MLKLKRSKKTTQRNTNLAKIRKKALKKGNPKKIGVKSQKKLSFSLQRGFKFSSIFEGTEWSILALSLTLLAGGLLMIFSASAIRAYEDHNGDTFYYFKRQIIWIILGGISATGIYLMPIKALRKLSTLFLGGAIFLLLYMLPEAAFGKTIQDGNDIILSGIQMPFVVAKNGATRWIEIGGFSLQPSELVKFGVVLYLAAWLTRDFKIKDINSKSEHFKKVLAPFSILMGIISVLILAQSDFDTTVIIFLIAMPVYYISGNDRIHTLGTYLLSIFAGIVGSFALVLEDYRRDRLNAFFEIFLTGRPSVENAQEKSFQVWHGLLAMGSGGLLGVGYGQSKLKLGFLQDAAYTDSIFVVIGEEFGLIGSLAVTLGFLYFAVIGFKIASKADDKFASLVAVGASSWISIQAFLNIASNIALIPFGGMPLPFFSYGGTSTITSMLAVGLLLNVSRHSGRKKKSRA
ncbi:MAG: putative peptidoglycan glycosyltransferase FtsW [Candidatus Dojkabacteria bacterium]|nr:putative peptidoglycan glycosyltransferase FtsW [Candidatus Dojkabacteria bacterium]MDQ7020756.1 putative peptidoglycan glycosyltransferase FtsW [Candidatus Dojkabacteria bacterium]